MSVRFRRFEPDDVARIALQASQWIEAGIDMRAMTVADADDLLRDGEAWTAIDEDFRILCCAGIRTLFAGRHGVAWAMLAEGLGVAAHLAITRFARARIADSPLTRVESMIADDAAGRCAKWALAVGMTREASLRYWGAASETIHVHARIREGGR